MNPASQYFIIISVLFLISSCNLNVESFTVGLLIILFSIDIIILESISFSYIFYTRVSNRNGR